MQNSQAMELLKEFFELQYKEGLSERFADVLSDDFNRVMHDFNDFVVKKHLGLSKLDINFHDVVVVIINELCGFKLTAIKMHADMLTKSAKEAKQLEGLQQGIKH